MRRFLCILTICGLAFCAYGCGGAADAPNTMSKEEKEKKGQEEAKKRQEGMKDQMDKLKESGRGPG